FKPPERVRGRPDPELDPVRHAGPAPMFAGNAGPFLVDVQGNDTSFGLESQRHCEGARAGERADFEDVPSGHHSDKQREQVALLGRNLHAAIGHLMSEPTQALEFVMLLRLMSQQVAMQALIHAGKLLGHRGTDRSAQTACCARDQSADVKPDALTTSDQRRVSAATSCANSSGEPGAGVSDSVANPVLTASLSSAARRASLSAATARAGVREGTRMPNRSRLSAAG